MRSKHGDHTSARTPDQCFGWGRAEAAGAKSLHHRPGGRRRPPAEPPVPRRGGSGSLPVFIGGHRGLASRGPWGRPWVLPGEPHACRTGLGPAQTWGPLAHRHRRAAGGNRSEEHTSELQSLAYLVCRLLLEKKKKTKSIIIPNSIRMW